jgi:hypothetical protein
MPLPVTPTPEQPKPQQHIGSLEAQRNQRRRNLKKHRMRQKHR